ncbi:SRPBCC family protein [Ktedonobacteria bacterium brp13]|nr:SRPBCC family protein [Ktedonobacteria bacterium brp13]
MPDYQYALTIQASPDKIEEFISKVDNLPKYLPTTKKAEAEKGERVRVEGEAKGHKYNSDGYFRVDKARHRMEWGSDGEQKYSGWLQITPLPQGNASEVTVHLTFEPSQKVNKNLTEQTGSKDTTIEEDLQHALISIKNICEGHGGKVEPKSSK